MKKTILFAAIFALFLFSGCNDEEYVAPDSLSDVSWYTSVYPGKPYAVNQGEYISFMDVSVGTLTHEWSIEEGNYFLNSKFKDNDSLPLFIIPNAGLKTSNTTIHVLFDKPGISKVRLYNTFPEKVTYNASVPFESVKVGDVWVVDTTFTVDVYEHIKPAFNIYQDGTLVLSVGADDEPSLADQASWDTIYVEAGAGLEYVDMTTEGRPNARAWTAEGGAFSSSTRIDSVATVKYFKLGSYTSSFKSSRGGDLPVAAAEKVIPAIIKVIPSSQPFVFNGGLTELADEVIRFKVTGEVAPFTGEESSFTVHVKNTAAGFEQDIPVVLAKVNDTDATRIDLKLGAPIYNSDVITVSYSGNIKSTDSRDLQDFGPEQATVYFAPNLLNATWAGFDVAHTNIRNAYATGYWVGPTNDASAGGPYFARLDGLDSPTGLPVMSFTMNGGITKDMTLQGSSFGASLTDGGVYNYLVSFKIYITPGSNLKKILHTVQNPFTTINWDLTGVAEGKWVTLKQVVSLGVLPTGRLDLKVTIADNPGAGNVKFYIDDYSFQTYEVRP